MREFSGFLFSPLPNAITTGLMLGTLVYWTFNLMTGFGLGDFDIDIDTEADTEANPDTDVSIDQEPTEGWFMRVLKFMNIGKAPFMMILSTLKFFMWTGSLITTQLIDVTRWGWKSILILIPILLVSIVFTHYATKPLVLFFHKLGYKGEQAINILGKDAFMLSSIQGTKVGAAEIKINDDPIKIMVISEYGEEISHGELVSITNARSTGNIYYVTKKNKI